MSCTVIYKANDNTKIENVLNPFTNEPSNIFKTINESVLVHNKEQAYEIYKAVINDNGMVEDGNNSKPRLNYQIEKASKEKKGGKIRYYKMSDLLSDYESTYLDNNIEISLNIETNDGKSEVKLFKIDIQSIDKETVNNQSDINSFILSSLKEGIISDLKQEYNGEYYIVPNGQMSSTKALNKQIFKEKIRNQIGMSKIKPIDGTVFFKVNDTKYNETNSELENVALDDLANNSRKFNKEYNKNINSTQNTEQNYTEDELSMKFMDLLSELGIKVTSISNYVENYAIRNGVAPNALSLADIANKVIAFKDGKIGVNDLSEEVSHFIVEAFNDQNIINDLTRNIHNTAEWQQFSKLYFDTYSKEIKGNKDELDNAVRREILGKVLSNAFINNFGTLEQNQENEINNNIIAKLKEIFDSFIERVSTFFNVNKHYDDLDKFTNQVISMFNNGTLIDNLNMYQTEDVKFRFYSLGNGITSNNELNKSLVQGIRVLENQISTLLKGNKGLNVDKTKLKALNQDLEDNLILQATVGLIDLTNSHVNYIKKGLETANKEGDNHFMTVEEDNVYYSLTQRMSPIIDAIKGQVSINAKEEKKEGRRRSEWANLESQLNDLILNISDIKGIVSVQKNGAIERWANRMIERHNYPESYKEELMKYATVMEKDTNSFFLYIGQLMHSHDPLLNLFGTMTADTIKQSNQKFTKRAKEFMLKLDTIGVRPQQLKELFDNGYLLDEVNHYEYRKLVEQIEIEEYKSLTNDNRTIEEILEEKNRNGELELFEKLTIDQKAEHQRNVKNRLREYNESPFIEEYYKQVQKKYRDLNISNVTIAFINNLSADRGSLTKKATENNIIDYSKLNEYEFNLLQQLKRERANAKSFYDVEGHLKSGIEIIDESDKEYDENKVVKVGDFIYRLNGNNISTEAQIAFDLNKLDIQYVKDQEASGNKRVVKSGITNSFKSALRNSKDKVAFLKSNATIMLSDDVWDKMIDNNSIESRLEAVGLSNEAYSLRNIKTQLKAILKTSPTLNRPSEIDADGLSIKSRKRIKELQGIINEKIKLSYSQLKKLEEENGITVIEEELDNKSIISKTTNQSFKQYLIDNNIDENESPLDVFNFILDGGHITDRDKSFISELRYSLSDAIDGVGKGLTKAQKRIVEQYIGEDGLDNLEDYKDTYIEDILLPYAKSRLLPYYSRYVTSQYDMIMDGMEKGGKDFDYEDFISKVEDGTYNEIAVIPNYSYMEEIETNMMNPNYRSDYEGGYVQPKKEKFLNKKYIEKFNPDRNGNPTTNIQLYNALQILKEFQVESLKSLDEYGKHNLFRLPQISKNSLDKAMNLAGGISTKKISEIIKDFSMYRVDDLQKGEVVGSGVNATNRTKLIPKYYMRDLENQQDISDELLYSYMLFGQQADLYEARRNNIGDALAIRDTLLNRESGNGKDVKLSNTLKMFESYLDYNFYGIKENGNFEVSVMGRKVDLTKMVRGLGSWIQLRNLGLNPIIAATSAITAEVNYSLLEKRIGEYVNMESNTLANNEFRKIGFDAVSEIGQFKSKSRINTILEHIGVYNISERFQNSGYDYGLRNTNKLIMGVHQLANYPIIPRVVLSVLYDYRVVGNNILNYNQFKRAELLLNKDLSNKQLEEKWKTFEDKAFYNYIKTENGIFSLDYEKFAKDIVDKQDNILRDFVDNKYYGIIDQVKNITKNVDGSLSQEEKSLAHRNFLMSYFTTHRNWLVTALQRRFKGRHYSSSTGELEEGHYITPYRMLGDVFKNAHSINPITFAKELKKAYNEGTVEERRNIQRVALDYVILTTLGLMGYLLSSISDDDDKEDLIALQMANYLLARTVNETASIQGVGLAAEVLSVIKSPFVGWQVVTDLYSLPSEVFSGKIIESGKYKNYTESSRILIKTIPGAKSIFDMADPKSAFQTYNYFNGSNLSPALVLLIKEMNEKEENE